MSMQNVIIKHKSMASQLVIRGDVRSTMFYQQIPET